MEKCENCYHAEICKNYPNTGLPPKMRQELIHKGCEYYINNSDVQEVKHGYWIREHIGYGVTRYKCSVCGGRFGGDMIEDFQHNKFCSDCGARIDGNGR